MAKKKNLNGLPNSLVQRFYCTLFYYEKGYMADWIWNSAHQKDISDVVIDILNDTIEPKVLEIKAVMSYLPKLRDTVESTLSSNGFPLDFLKSVKIYISISGDINSRRVLRSQGIALDNDGRIYKGKVYYDEALESFNAF